MTEEPTQPLAPHPRGEGLGLFEAFGVELELMIVDSASLDVRPICDELIAAVAGAPVSEVDLGTISWSNELTLHVLELKTNGPAPSLAGLDNDFHRSVTRARDELSALGARLMPTAMHPWMDPHTETRLWPHEYTDVYHAFDRIFGCSGHGWANLQSTHLNLPFSGDDEFARLHAAIRLALPLIPALAASSPFQDGVRGPGLDSRLAAYRRNARRIPSVSGSVVPERVSTREEYERTILGRIYADLEPHDPQGVLRHEWVNARGAIARFDRGTIEIRLIDSQECPAADVAVVAAIVALVRSLAVGRLAERDLGEDPSTESLAALLEAAVLNGDRAVAEDAAISKVLGLRAESLSLGDLWAELLDRDPPEDSGAESREALDTCLREGPLAKRMLRAVGEEPSRSDLRALAVDLCGCLDANEPFVP